MAVNQLSPGVQVVEKYSFGGNKGASSTVGAYVGEFTTGPAMQPILIDTEKTLLEVFGKPNNKNAKHFLAAANFLAYTKAMYVVRAVASPVAATTGTTGQTKATNASCDVAPIYYDAGTNYDTSAYDSDAIQINNITHYTELFAAGVDSNNSLPNGKIFSYRYPGTIGNGVMVAIVDKGNIDLWNNGIAARVEDLGAIPPIPGRAAVPGLGSTFGKLPNITTTDVLHVVVIDTLGKIAGTPNTVLETYTGLSKNPTAQNYQGLSNYYINVLRDKSAHVYVCGHPANGTSTLVSGASWGADNLTPNPVFKLLQIPDDATITAADIYTHSYVLTSGSDGFVIPIGGTTPGAVSASIDMTNEIITAWDLFKDTEAVDVSLLISGNASIDVAKAVRDVAEYRRDCVAFVSVCDITDGNIIMGGNSTDRLNKATAWKTSFGNTTYSVIDTGYKYQYDKYNDAYRWVALNADVAGLCAKVDSTHDEWFSPAGLSKGQIKGVVKLAWNPNKAERDVLYPLAINAVVTFTGDGTVLFGDRTATIDPSPFDRINVRRLFIGLEKSISRSARYRLFDQNDDITRTLWKSQVEPILRDVKGRRGIEAYKVICDETNNPPAIVAANEFRGTILIKPIYSINFITLTFTAVGPDVSFETAAGL
jgi:Phage tail sheath protein subtilisin-like domain/Phage tail sheath C-terminal domain